MCVLVVLVKVWKTKVCSIVKEIIYSHSACEKLLHTHSAAIISIKIFYHSWTFLSLKVYSSGSVLQYFSLFMYYYAL